MENEITLCRRGCCPTCKKIGVNQYLVKHGEKEMILSRENVEILYEEVMKDGEN